tara:strand:+ start:1123 stop:1287 length:165 start_codon:yes stop_codon:yes gene_type:complete
MNLFSLIHVRLLGDGALLGFTYFSKDDRIPEYADEDWYELNIYLIILAITFRWH